MNIRRDVFQALADPTRRSILLLLATQAMTAGSIAARFDTARPTVSKHLQILSECQLVVPQPQGREIYYHLDAQALKEADDFLAGFRNLWDERFDRLEAIMKQNPES